MLAIVFIDGISHILGNTLCILAYGKELYLILIIILHVKCKFDTLFFYAGAFFETYHPFHSLALIFVYHISLVFGTLGFTFFWPYQGLIGASPGAYGLLGACLSLVIFFRPFLDHFVAFCLPFILIAHIIGDILLYAFNHNSNIGYASHFFGAITGFLFVTAFCCFHHKSCIINILSVISMLSFLFITVALLYIYIVYFPPLIYETSWAGNSGSDEGCCAQYFSLVTSFPKYSKDFILDSSTCSNGQFRSPFFNVTNT